MTLVDSSKLLGLRVKKAVTLINLLRADNKELHERLDLVTNHNEELQELIAKTSADSKEIEAALASANDALDLAGIDFDTFDIAGQDELADAEAFTVDGTGVELEDVDLK